MDRAESTDEWTSLRARRMGERVDELADREEERQGKENLPEEGVKRAGMKTAMEKNGIKWKEGGWSRPEGTVEGRKEGG